MSQTRHIQAIVPEPLAERLQARAQASERSVSAEVRLILRTVLGQNDESAGQGALTGNTREAAHEYAHA